MSNMLASDMNNTEFTGATNPDSLLHVVFYSKPVYQEFASKEAGSPIFKDMDCVRIHTPGNQLNVIDRIAVDEDKKRFPLHWARYEQIRGDSEVVVGTPVGEWPLLSRAQAEILRGMKFFSVEQIAGASDEAMSRIGMNVGFSAADLQNKARAFLRVAKDANAAEKQDAELKKRDAEIAEMKEQIAKLTAAQAGGADKTLHLKKGA